jgi:hypothetical protein
MGGDKLLAWRLNNQRRHAGLDLIPAEDGIFDRHPVLC